MSEVKKEVETEVELLNKLSLKDSKSIKSPPTQNVAPTVPSVDQQSAQSPHPHPPIPQPQFIPQYPYQYPPQPYQIPPSIALIPQALRSALTNPNHRAFVIGLESDLLNFIASNTDSYLLSPMNSFYRLLTHKTAEYYSLGHSLNKEGNSIIVYKNFGVELVKPQPLNSIPIQQLWGPDLQHLPHAPPIPFPVQMNPQFHPQFHQQYNPIRSNNELNEVKKENSNPPKEFKIMKREESESKSENSTIAISESEKEAESSNENINPKDLENERASKETIYQKARERIFQNSGEEEEEEDEEEEEEPDLNNNNNARVFHPQYQQPFIPQGPGVPQGYFPMTNGPVPFPYYQYPMPGVIPAYPTYDFDPYHNQYNKNYKKNRGGYTGGYRRNNYQGRDYNQEEKKE